MRPEYVYVNGYRISIEYVLPRQLQSPRRSSSTEDSVYGEFELGALAIRVRCDMPDEIIRATLIHELMHAIDYTGIVPRNAFSGGSDDDPAELFAATMERLLWPVLSDRRNRTFWHWVLGDEEVAEDALEGQRRTEAYEACEYPDAEAQVG